MHVANYFSKNKCTEKQVDVVLLLKTRHYAANKTNWNYNNVL